MIGLIIWIEGLLVMVTWQDFKHREVSWYVFPLLAISLVLNAWFMGGLDVMEWLLNVLLISIQLVILQFFCFFKYGHWLMAGERYLGWGDMLFFLVLTFAFSCMNFLFFNLMTFSGILLFSVLYRRWGGNLTEIPLAGGQALALAVLLAVNIGNGGRHLYMNEYLIKWLPWM